METHSIMAQNIKCDGCARTIREGLAPLPGIDEVEVDIQSGEVTLRGETVDLPMVRSKLAELGYPAVD